MTTVTALLTNKAYGFPARGARRRMKAPILACIHVTGNRRTAANPDRSTRGPSADGSPVRRRPA